MVLREAGGWVVFRTPVDGLSDGAMAVCHAAEWPALAAARPGQLTLVQAGVASEGLAERLARGTTGDPVPRAKPAARPDQPAFAGPAVPVGVSSATSDRGAEAA